MCLQGLLRWRKPTAELQQDNSGLKSFFRNLQRQLFMRKAKYPQGLLQEWKWQHELLWRISIEKKTVALDIRTAIELRGTVCGSGSDAQRMGSVWLEDTLSAALQLFTAARIRSSRYYWSLVPKSPHENVTADMKYSPVCIGKLLNLVIHLSACLPFQCIRRHER